MRQRLASVVLAASLAAFALRCGGSDPPEATTNGGDAGALADGSGSLGDGEASRTDGGGSDAGPLDDAAANDATASDATTDAAVAPGSILANYNGQILGLGYYSGRTLAVDDLGRAYIAGECPSSLGGGIGVMRLTTDGNLDATFGAAGVSCHDAPASYRSWAVAIAIAPSGQLRMAAVYIPYNCLNCPLRVVRATMSANGSGATTALVGSPDGGALYTGEPHDIAPDGTIVGDLGKAFVADDAGTLEISALSALFSVHPVPEGLIAAGQAAASGMRIAMWSSSAADASILAPAPPNSGPNWSLAQGMDVARETSGSNLLAVRLSAGSSGTPVEALVVRVFADGGVDSTFGGGTGYVSTKLSSYYGSSFRLLFHDNAFYGVGTDLQGTPSAAVAKFWLDGTVAPFGNGGIKRLAGGADAVIDAPRQRMLVLTGGTSVTALAL